MSYELPPERIADLQEAQRHLRDAKALCDRMAKSGYDSEAQQRFCAALDERIAAVLREFGPRKRNA